MIQVFRFICLLLLCSIAQAQVPVRGMEGYHLLDEDGDTLSDRPYEYIHPRSGDFWLAYDQGEFFYLNSLNYKPSFKRRFPIAYPFKDHFALIKTDNHYRYLSDLGLILGEIDWPKAPEAFDEVLLISNKQNHLINRKGDTLLSTKNPLFVGEKIGILEWNKELAQAKQYHSRNGQISFLQSFEEVDSLAFNHQGHIIIQKNGLYNLYNNKGQLLVENQKARGYYRGPQMVWNHYFFADSLGQLKKHYENELSSYPLVDASSCLFRGQTNSFGPAVYLSEAFANEGVAQLRGTDKWLCYDGDDRNLDGRYLFDEVLPSDDRHYLIVRIQMDWFRYDKREDSLMLLPWRFVHPFGLADGRIFGSNSNGHFKAKKWAYHHIEKGKISEEQYRFPPEIYPNLWISSPLMGRNPELAEEHLMLKEEQILWLNKEGQEFATEAAPEFYPLKLPDIFCPNLELKADSRFKLKRRGSFARNRLQVKFEAQDQKLQIELVNTQKDSVSLIGYGDQVEAWLQYELRPGKWRTISRFDAEDFQDPSYLLSLAPMEGLRLERARASGNYQVNARIKILVNEDRYIYSESQKIKVPAVMLDGLPFFAEYGAISYYQFNFDRELDESKGN